MPDPYAIASAASLGASALSTFFGPDPDELNERARLGNERMIRERWAEIQRIYGRRGEFFEEQMDIFNPQLAFAETQGKQAASAGARAAQAGLRRRLGSGGDVFAAALATGSRTIATDRQNTLRALATSEAMKAAINEAKGRAGMLAQQPLAFHQPATGARSMRRSSLFAQVGTGLGALATNRQQTDDNDGANAGYLFEPDYGGPTGAYGQMAA